MFCCWRRNPGSYTRWILSGAGSFYGKAAWGKADRWAASSGAVQRTSGTFTFRCLISISRTPLPGAGCSHLIFEVAGKYGMRQRRSRLAQGSSAAEMAPPTLIPGVVFAGSLDGHLRAYDTRQGDAIWDFDTAQEFRTTNGVRAHGGSLNGAGPTIVAGMLYVNTGYTNAMAGNVLLAFSVAAK
jgi:PQQ enzyme repeat